MKPSCLMVKATQTTKSFLFSKNLLDTMCNYIYINQNEEHTPIHWKGNWEGKSANMMTRETL